MQVRSGMLLNDIRPTDASGDLGFRLRRRTGMPFWLIFNERHDIRPALKAASNSVLFNAHPLQIMFLQISSMAAC